MTEARREYAFANRPPLRTTVPAPAKEAHTMFSTMKKWIERNHRPAARSVAQASSTTCGDGAGVCDVPTPSEHSGSADACRLARELVQATSMGQWTLADRLADAALRTDFRGSPAGQRLAEGIARLRIAQGNPHAALAILQTVPRQRCSARLLETVCLMHVGQRIDALLLLRRWCDAATSPGTVPLGARLLLAFEDFAAGDVDDAKRLLRANLRTIEDPQSVRALIAISVATANDDTDLEEITMLVERLRATCVDRYDRALCDTFIGALRLPSQSNRAVTTEPRPEHVARLARELEACEESIQPLVAAQLVEPDLPTAQLLHASLREAMASLRDRQAAMQSLATISVLVENLENQHHEWVAPTSAAPSHQAPLRATAEYIHPSTTQQRKGKAA